MKPILTQLALSAMAIGLFSCGENKESSSAPKSFSLEITDSIQVDFLGDMMLMDYDPKAGKYLLSTEVYYEYLEVDENGKILNHHKFSEDGVAPVSQAMGLGYFNGD